MDAKSGTDVRNIIILLAGTVDPICIRSSKKTRATSYSKKDGRGYWDESPELISKLKRLCDKFEHLALFDSHGWSGDNTKENRQIPEKQLATNY